MSVRAYFSGVEGKIHFDACVSAGVRHVLTSFLYMEGKSDPHIVKRRKEANPEMGFYIDSGAHTFQLNRNKYASWTISTYEDYVKRYARWIRINRKYIDAAAELDIDYVVGIGTVERWRKQYFRPLEEEYGIPITYVWHPSMRLEGWEELCANHAYVGLPGEMSSDSSFNKFISVARRYTVKVHGFAATKQLDFRDIPWFCMTDEHKILTKRGWSSRSEVTTDDFALVRLDDGSSEWQSVEKVFEYSVRDIPIVEFSSRTFNSQTTKNHRWLSLRKRGRDRRTVKEWRITSELDEDDRIPRCSTFSGVKHKHFSDEFVEVAAWYWTEGGLNKGSVTISQSFRVNSEKVRHIRRALVIGGFRFREWNRESDGCTYFALSAKATRKLTSLMPNRVISMEFLNLLTEDQLKLFVRTSVKGDGTKTPRVKEAETFQLFQSLKIRTDMFEIACILAGFPVSRSVTTNSNGYTSYGVGVSNVEMIYPYSAEKREFLYTGKIWCIGTKGQNFLTRCKDKVYFTGNSIDSITWKTCEMYGTLIDWDDNKQKLKFEQNKPSRAKYRDKLVRLGFNADAIIKDTDYKEVTRYALFSMRRMEAFYEKRYSDRIFFYELRLPFPKKIRKWKPKKVRKTWTKFTPEKNFEHHKVTKDPEKLRGYLIAISAVQNRLLPFLENDKVVRDFLLAYFANLMEPQIADFDIFQKELSAKIAPPNPPPLERSEAAHYFESNNPPKQRLVPDFRVSELFFDTFEAPVPTSEIINT